MSDDVYVKLRKFLDDLPGGYPETDTGVEIRLLKKLFTPEQARITIELKPFPEPASAIAKRLEMDEGKVAQKLDQLAKEGSIMRAKLGDQTLYMGLSFVVGIYEFHLNSIDRELSELMEEYMPYLAKIWQEVPTTQLRVVPINSAVEGASSTIATYDSIRELIKNKTLISVAPCICRKERDLMGDPCKRTLEVCIQFDLAAQYYLENGMSREITRAELMDLLALGEKEGLVLTPTNSEDIMNICMCCGCCCGLLRTLRTFEKPAEVIQPHFQANIDPDLCSACGTCLERCQIDAIVEGDVHEVNPDRCIGCGLCVPTCPEEAISMQAVEGAKRPPKDIFTMNIQIAKERGKL